MLKCLKTLIKIFEGLMWLYMPIIIFYWTLTLIQLDALTPLRTVVGIPVYPVIGFLNEYFNFQFYFGESEIDYTPFVLTIIVGLSIFISIFISNSLDFIDEKIEKIKIEWLKKQDIDAKKKLKNIHIKELNKNKIIYVLFKILKIESHENYLVQKDDDSFSIGLIDSYETSIKNIAKSFSGKEFKSFSNDPALNSFIFTDTEQFVIFLKYFIEKIKEINKGTKDDLNTVFNYTIACSCSYDTATAETDLSLTKKVLNLVGNNEIFITDILKQKLDHIDTDLYMEFESKGIYILDEKDLDIYKLRID